MGDAVIRGGELDPDALYQFPTGRYRVAVIGDRIAGAPACIGVRPEDRIDE
jgi:hypothetical protein